MTGGLTEPQRRVQRLLRWYPGQWRARYGDEFSELLEAEMAERPRCLRRSVDVAAGGIMARLADAGLAGAGMARVAINRSDQARRSLATFGCCIAVFLAFAVSMWSQLDIARRWSEPATPITHRAIVVMTAALFSGLALVAVGAVPIVWHSAVSICRRRTPQLWRPALLFVAGAAVLVVGGWHFRSGWGGSGTHPFGVSGAVAFMWASTLAVSAYWAHPSVLGSFPLSETIWMVVSPVALIATVCAAATIVRRVDLPAGLLRFTNRVAQVIVLALGVFVFGTLMWLVDGGPGPNNLFQAGTVDRIGLAVLTAALGLAVLSARSPGATA